ncbi:hypothetical protein Tco_0751949 [Tanacetum coccineum]|uniref:Uncharacterized protein n=1 Tax=Tanacetum coccineum TaxID=301880 RepID=A0ABQ4Z5G4_9ASTR
MFIRSVVFRRRVEDLQLGVESYQKKLNFTRPDTYISDVKRKTPYTAYSTPKCFIYQNKDKKNKLMRIDELHKFSDGTLNDVREQKVIKELRKIRWWEIVWGRPSAAGKDHMIYHMISLSKQVKPREHAEFDESNTYVLERFYTSAGNPVKEILLKLNLPDHRILKDGGEGT